MESRGIFFLAHMTTSRNLYTIIPWMFCFCDIPFTFNDPDEITRRTNHNPRCNYIPWNYAPENKPSQKETIVFQPLILIPMFREGSFAGSKFIKTYPWCFSKNQWLLHAWFKWEKMMAHSQAFFCAKGWSTSMFVAEYAGWNLTPNAPWIRHSSSIGRKNLTQSALVYVLKFCISRQFPRFSNVRMLYIPKYNITSPTSYHITKEGPTRKLKIRTLWGNFLGPRAVQGKTKSLVLKKIILQVQGYA